MLIYQDRLATNIGRTQKQPVLQRSLVLPCHTDCSKLNDAEYHMPCAARVRTAALSIYSRLSNGWYALHLAAEESRELPYREPLRLRTLRLVLLPLDPQILQQNGLFLEFSLCLSRACLGKMMHFIYEWLKKPVFSPPMRSRTAACHCLPASSARPLAVAGVDPSAACPAHKQCREFCVRECVLRFFCVFFTKALSCEAQVRVKRTSSALISVTMSCSRSMSALMAVPVVPEAAAAAGSA
jgi:hypothetical protein